MCLLFSLFLVLKRLKVINRYELLDYAVGRFRLGENYAIFMSAEMIFLLAHDLNYMQADYIFPHTHTHPKEHKSRINFE